jgi:hypothetical protein
MVTEQETAQENLVRVTNFNEVKKQRKANAQLKALGLTIKDITRGN